MSKKITTIVEEYVGDDTDALKITIPLFIRLLEYAKEDAKSDVDLHKLTEKIAIHAQLGKVLGIESYPLLVPEESNGNMTNGSEPEQPTFAG